MSGGEPFGGMTSSPRTLLALATLINRRCGLFYERRSLQTLERRLAVRVRLHGLSTFEDYLALLERDVGELNEIFEILTTKETYFFRQDYQLNAFIHEVLPRLVEANGPQGRLTVWSAGCSSGEETYTLAILLSESPLLVGWKVRVLGTDLCVSNIEAAERGIYRDSSFRSTPKHRLEQYFSKVEGGYSVNADLRRHVHFSVRNLMDPTDVRSVGRVDVVFCRNVLIYFDDVSRHAVTDLFYERLLPGGYLFLGHSESLLNADTNFEPVHLEGDLVYRRPDLKPPGRERTR